MFASFMLGACIASGDEPASSTAPEVKTDSSKPVDLDEIPDRETVNLLMANCMADKGWRATCIEGPGGGVRTGEVADEQQSELDADFRECDEQLIADGVIPDPSRPLSDEFVRSIFERDLELHACLIDQGFPVPEAISWETYLEMYRIGEEFWDPLSRVRESARAAEDEDLLVRASDACITSN